jgi:putative transposase
MPQSFCRILVHLVFATRLRKPLLTSAIRRELHPYMATTIRNTDCLCLEVGGVEDHVHVLFGLSRTHPISKVVEIVKKSSSRWIKTKGAEFAGFRWQKGYAAFSVRYTDSRRVVQYIRNQERHHRRKTLDAEFREFLQRHNVGSTDPISWE